jgi:DNA-3-methyladenine glycosylase II
LLDETQLEQADTAEATRRLTQIKGVGRWSAEYALLRGLGRIDIYPGDDVGARNKLRRFLGLDHDPDYAEIAELLRPWQPCAGMLYFHLLLRGLADNGELTL